jgi:hypothetical protein
MQGRTSYSKLNNALQIWRDLNRLIILVASIAFVEAITLTEACKVIIIELQD